MIKTCPICDNGILLKRVSPDDKYYFYCPLDVNKSDDPTEKTHFLIDYHYIGYMGNNGQPSIWCNYLNHRIIIMNGVQIDICEMRSPFPLCRLPIILNFLDFKKSVKDALIDKMPELFLKGEDLENFKIL